MVYLDDNFHFIRLLPAEHFIRVDNILIDFPDPQVLELVCGVERGKVSRLSLHLQKETAGLNRRDSSERGQPKVVYLNIKWIPLHVVVAEEPDVVEPAESDLVLQPSKQVSVLNVLRVGQGVVAGPGDGQDGVLVYQSTQSVLSVGKHKVWHPDLLLLLRRESVEPRVGLQVVESQPGVEPGEMEKELNLEYRTDLVDVQYGDNVSRHINHHLPLGLTLGLGGGRYEGLVGLARVDYFTVKLVREIVTARVTVAPAMLRLLRVLSPSSPLLPPDLSLMSTQSPLSQVN